MTGRSRTGPATRAALLDAAVEAVVELGWQGASVREIATRSGGPVGGIHYHFGGREALLVEAAMAELVAMFATPAAAIDAAETVDELLGAILGWARTADVSPQRRTVLLETMAASRRDPDVAVALAGALAGYRAGVGAALARVAGPAATLHAAALVAHADGLWLHQLVEPGYPAADAAATAIALWRRVLVLQL